MQFGYLFGQSKLDVLFCTLGGISWAFDLWFGTFLYRWKVVYALFLVMLVVVLDSAPGTFYSVFYFLHYGGYPGCHRSRDWFVCFWWFIMTCTIFCLSCMPFLIFVDIICIHSYKHTEIKSHTTSVFFFSVVFLVFPSNSSSVI